MSKIGVILGTGPSLADVADGLRKMKADGEIMLFGINNTFEDFDLDVWIACDPAWHEHYGQVTGDFDKWHWREDIASKYGYRYCEGIWLDGLSLDPNRISLGHSSGWQALQLAAVQYQCDKVLLVGYDMTYRKNEPRHYFTNVSDVTGEYPQPLRKYSLFDKGKDDGLLWDYRIIADQAEWGDIPPVINCTPRSAMTWFPMSNIWSEV